MRNFISHKGSSPTLGKTTVLSYAVVLLVSIFGFNQQSNATKYGSSSATHSTVLGVEPGDTDQEVLMVTVNGLNGGGGAWQIDEITFTTANTSNADVDAAYCYYSTDATLDGGDVLKGTVANPAGDMAFTINEGGLGGTGNSYYIFLVYDIDASAVACSGNVVDALVKASGLVTSGNGSGNYTPSTNSPTGSRAIEGTGCWTYCSVGGTLSAYGYITNVDFDAISRSSAWDGGYIDTGNSTTVEQGENIPLTVSMTNSSTTGRYTAAWIDFNNDGDFDDAGEEVMDAEITTSSGSVTRTQLVSVPLSATIGATKMRVAWKYAPSQSAPEPCDTYTSYTEFEDYDITISAATPMAYVSSDVFQSDLTNMKAGIVKRQILDIQIVTSGASPAIAVTSFTFNTTGCSDAANDIENARLFYTGTDSTFSTGNPIGNIYSAPNGTFVMTISGGTELVNGTNYFWLTYDVQDAATCTNVADAQCTSITVGGSSYGPSTTSPTGTRTIDCITAYYSQGNLDVDLLSSWNSARNGSGSAPGSFGANDGFFVQAGHSMTSGADVTIPYLTLESGSYVTGSNLITCDYLVIEAGATFEQQYASVSGAYISDFFIYDEATWIHNNAGWLPAVNRYFDPNSNQWFYQWGGGTFPSNTTWGNIMLNGTTVGDFGMGTVLTEIQGDFEWRNIGTTGTNYLYDQIDETINVGGDLIFSGGYWQVAADNGFPFVGTANVTINVEGDFKCSSGWFYDYFSGSGESGMELNVGGNVEITGGTISLNNSPSGTSVINLTGGTSAVTWTQTGGTVTLCDVNIASGKEVTLVGNAMDGIASARTVTVQSGGALYCDTYPVSGAGNITVESGATLGVAATNAEGAITSTASAGNIQVTGTRTFSNGGFYIYNGSAGQVTGDQLPTTITGGLEIDNSGGDVSLTQNTQVDGALELKSGNLVSTSSERLTIGAAASINPVRGASGSFVSGWVDRVVNAAADFEVPIGSSPDGRWRPMTITGTDATTRTWTVEFVDNDPETDWGNTYDAGDSITVMNAFYYYNVTPSAAGTVDIKCWYDDADLGTIAEANTVVGHWSGSDWNCWNKDDMTNDYNRDATNNWVQVLGVSSFSPVGLGGTPLPLPIELLDFSATPGNGKVVLEWRTATEINNDYFTIERSIDGELYEEVGRVNGAGNSSKELSYELVDSQPYSGRSFYRVRQTDFDGKSTASNWESVVFEEDGLTAITAFPNPATDRVALSFQSETSGTGELKVYSASGQLVAQHQVAIANGQNRLPISLEGVSNGLYTISLTTNHKVYHTKVSVKL